MNSAAHIIHNHARHSVPSERLVLLLASLPDHDDEP